MAAILNSFYDGEDRDKRIQILGGALQHEWTIIEPLTVTVGVRYENVEVHVSNSSSYPIEGYGRMDKEETGVGIMPKSSMTYDLNHMADFLRDTTVIFALSRIWHAPDYHGTYDPQGCRPVHGLTPSTVSVTDLILSRRHFNDLYMKVGYSLRGHQWIFCI